LKRFAKKVISIGNEDIGYRILGTLNNYEDYNKIKYNIGRRELEFNHAYIMGILNVTPDSFSDGGLFLNREDAIKSGIDLIDSGADILDVGGESTRPGSDPVDDEEEIKRVLPVIEGVIKARPEALISVDTTKSSVAEKALQAGAVIINDISGLTFDPMMPEIAKRNNASVIIMHIKGIPKSMHVNPVYEDLIREIYNFLKERSSVAVKAGIKNIIIDPGIGFGKNGDHNFELLKRLEDFKSLGFPILVGLSRKSFLGNLLQLKINERDTATVIAETAAVLNGARIIRTHNVKNCLYMRKITGKLL
jgi:dihydropteroate synthase